MANNHYISSSPVRKAMKDKNYETLMDELIALRAKVSVVEGKKDAVKRKEQPTLEWMDDIGHSIKN